MSSERQEHNEVSPWWGEHIHRYQLALAYIKSNGKILDIACGNGFGSKMLCDAKKGEVIGADISKDVVDFCSRKYCDEKNLSFQVIDGTAIPFENNFFGSVVSFETIEHTTQYKKMLEEFYRIVDTNGVVIISTPNALITSPKGVIQNPYHTQEFMPDNLKEILKSVFEDVQLFGQKYVRYSTNKSFRFKFTCFLERLLYKKGVRKLSLSLKNWLFQLLINKDFYPSPSDFEVTDKTLEIDNCTTLFAVCVKKTHY